MVVDSQIILPGQAVVSVQTFDRNVGPYGNKIYQAVHLYKSGQETKVAFINDNYSMFDFSYYLANKPSITRFVNNQSSIRKNGGVISGFAPEDFSDLENLFKDHREAMKGIYLVSLRGGRVKYT